MVGALVISSCMDHLLAADTAGFCPAVLIGFFLSLTTGFHETVGTFLLLGMLSLCHVLLKLGNIKKNHRKKGGGNRQTY